MSGTLSARHPALSSPKLRVRTNVESWSTPVILVEAVNGVVLGKYAVIRALHAPDARKVRTNASTRIMYSDL
ncbi:uncharacterized protein RCC_04390 [Ramularia collo-cygni]|uniref:Uncharacterized protein n=1 Tax=Ramularia collo-cygni TaxID=112498 RepID=A0A2D3V4U0_9PEZI|nr:uncharacterized protein RCC_04390 [Ramularia collo-cygni]CZT18546.1 uncharacterized protein RCC_04390 [Ramularia collo-cygni]